MSLRLFRRTFGVTGSLLLGMLTVATLISQQPPQRFGGAYAELDQRRQQLVATGWRDSPR